jgi:site-specific recombinase XerC
MKALTTITKTNKPVDVMVAMERNPVVVFLSGQAPSSRYTCRFDLQSISTLLGYPDPFTCPWQALRFQHTQAIRTMLTTIVSNRTGKCLSLVTVNRKLSALRGVLKTAWRLGQMNAEDYYRAADVESVKGETLPAGRELDKREVTSLMDVCAADLTSAGARDAAIIALMYSCGLRRNEVRSLDLDDYDSSGKRLVVSGKRHKERTAYLVNEAAMAMRDWLRIRGDWEGALFLSFDGRWGKLAHRRMSGQAIYNMLDRRGRQAGLAKFSPHDMRRTFVSDLLDAGVDISTVSKMAGHASVTTTVRYDKRPEETKRKAAELLHVSYHARKYPERSEIEAMCE